MNNEFPTIELSEIADIRYGYTASASFECSGPRFLRITDIQDGDVDWEKVPSCEIDSDDHAKHKLRVGDLVFARTGATTGKSYLILDEIDAIPASYLIRVRIHSDLIDARFVSYYFQSPAYWSSITAGTTGSAQGGFNASKLGALRIPSPPIDQQMRIVKFLDEAFEEVAKAKADAARGLTSTSELFSAVLNSKFSNQSGWRSFELGQEVRFIDYRGKTPPKRPEGIRLITAKNVKQGFVQRAPEEFIDPSCYDDWMTRGFPEFGDVLFTTEAPLGNVAQLDTDETVVIGQRLITMQTNQSDLRNEFLKWLLMSPAVQAEIWSRATGATVQGIKAKLLKQVPLSVPSIEEQDLICRDLQAVWDWAERLKAIYKEKSAGLDELKSSLLHRAFSGEFFTAEGIAA